MERQRLIDNDPGVMGATLCPLFDLISEDANSYKDLIVSLVSILKQVAEKRLPTTYDYHHMPAPFIQVVKQPPSMFHICLYSLFCVVLIDFFGISFLNLLGFFKKFWPN
jgi:hypothetical protein